MNSPKEQLTQALRRARSSTLAVVTGAGISLASGIPTFRGSDPDAVWKQDVTELGTLRYFQHDPVGSWHWYTSRFDQVLDKVPNAAHEALVDIERWYTLGGGRFTLVSQNVDTLHEAAGTSSLIKVHGSVDRIRCSALGCRFGAPTGSLARAGVDINSFIANPSAQTLPRCPDCRAILRPHVLWFDEFYDGHDDYQWPRVMDIANTMKMLLFVGTSFAVGVTELFLQLANQRNIPTFAIDPGVRDAPHPGITLIREPAECVLPGIASLLSADS